MLQTMFPCTREMEFRIRDKFNIELEKKSKYSTREDNNLFLDRTWNFTIL